MPATVISSWTDLAKEVERLAPERMLFRGERTADRPLLPRAGREGNYNGAARKVPWSLDSERLALARFQREARPYLPSTIGSDWEWLAIAQHHGMSTRLLDWSESLLVAAYFAVESLDFEGAGAVIYGLSGLPEIDAFTHQRLIEWRIPDVAVRQHIKWMLNACAINEATLFPGIDGLSRHIGWLYKWDGL